MKKENMKKQSPFGQECGHAASTSKRSNLSATDLQQLMNPAHLNYFGSGSIHEC